MYKNLKSTVKDIDQKGQVVVAANAFGNVDAHNDISVAGSFTKTITENFDRVKWFLNHNPSLLLGVPVSAMETMQYLQITGQLNMNKTIGKDTYEDYKLYAEHGKTLEHSIGVDPIKFEIKDGIRKVTEWKLWEFSTLTSWGANENTPMLQIKSASDAAAQIEWLEMSIRKANYTDEKCKQIESQLIKLKSLLNEPSADTQVVEPIDWKGISNQFLTTLKK